MSLGDLSETAALLLVSYRSGAFVAIFNDILLFMYLFDRSGCFLMFLTTSSL